MADIAILIDTTADPAATYTALTTTDGVAGWWTTRNQTSGTVGEVDQMWFPDAPMAWELRVDEAVPGKVLAHHCVGGPPQWIGTNVRFAPRGGAAGRHQDPCSTTPASHRSTRCSASSPSDGHRCCSTSSSTWTAASRRPSSASNPPFGVVNHRYLAVGAATTMTPVHSVTERREQVGDQAKRLSRRRRLEQVSAGMSGQADHEPDRQAPVQDSLLVGGPPDLGQVLAYPGQYGPTFPLPRPNTSCPGARSSSVNGCGASLAPGPSVWCNLLIATSDPRPHCEAVGTRLNRRPARSTPTTAPRAIPAGIVARAGEPVLDVPAKLAARPRLLGHRQRESTGPPCLEIGRQVRYRRAAVERWSTGSIQAGSPGENR